MNQIAQQIAAQGGVEAYLQAQQNKQLLRFLTCGSVDDGKSTLIGRLLHDTHQVYIDQLDTLHHDSRRIGTAGEKLDMALLVDGLQAEREQGITIDVAYRYFSTDRRKFIIADTPGHEQYTRNMATGASNCDVAILLIDARKGIQTQTRRHSFIATLLGIRHLLIAVNKMDLMGYQQQVFHQIQQEYLAFAGQLRGDPQIHFVPLSALDGDNVVNASLKMPWYNGPTLLQLLETVEMGHSRTRLPIRFPVQLVNRPDSEFRGYAGTLSCGTLPVGQAVKILPSGVRSRVTRIVTFEGDRPSARPDEAITLVLADELDISRGDVLVAADDPLQMVQRAQVDVVWMADQPLRVGNSYDVKIAGKKGRVQIDSIEYQLDINKLEKLPTQQLPLNGIGLVTLTFSEAQILDSYRYNRDTGSFIFIDRLSNITVGAGLVCQPLLEEHTRQESFSAFELELNQLICRHFPHWRTRDLQYEQQNHQPRETE